MSALFRTGLNAISEKNITKKGLAAFYGDAGVSIKSIRVRSFSNVAFKSGCFISTPLGSFLMNGAMDKATDAAVGRARN